MERKSVFSTRMLVEGAMMIAIATVLSFIKLAPWVYGGSITAGSMVPILVFAYRWGGVRGMFVGAVYGLLQFLLAQSFVVHPLSVIIDYPLAFAAVGFMGFMANDKSSPAKVVTAITVALGLRFVAHFLSGFIFFASYAPEGTHPVIYSLIYNASYMVPEIIISVIVFMLLRKALGGIK